MQERVNQFLDYLQVKNEFDQTLYGHLAQIIAKLLDDRPADAVASMGQISREIKASAGAREDNQEIGQLLTEEEWGYVDEMLNLLAAKPLSIGENADLPLLQDFVQLNQILNSLGRGIPEDQARLLQQRIYEFALANKKAYKEINFFGIFTTKSVKNYYVIEALPADERVRMVSTPGNYLKSTISDDFKKQRLPKMPTPSKEQIKELKKLKKQDRDAYVWERFDQENLRFEATTLQPPKRVVFQQKYRVGDGVHREGVNRYVYFVIQQLNGTQEWIQLPDAEARQIMCSRYVKNIQLSGDLTQPIHDQLPVFPGVECDYLRCLIARIKHSSQLAPSDILNFDEPEDQEADDDEEEGKKLPSKHFRAEDVQDPGVPEIEKATEIDKNYAKKHFVTWPVVQEVDALEYEGLIGMDRWSHCCPVLSHQGVVILRDEEEEPAEEEENEDEDNGDAEGAEEEANEEEQNNDEAQGEEGEEAEEKEPKIEPAQSRLDKLFKESDQYRLLEENATQLKQIAKQKSTFYVPASHFQLTRDTWQEPRKENRSIYIQDRFFGTENYPVDINCKQLELPEKEQRYWDKQAEKEEKIKASDEVFAEGDVYDEEKELNRDDKPGQTADGDKPILVHNVDRQQITVNPDGEGIVTIPAYRTIYNKQLGKKSPIIQESNRWAGFMNVAYMSPQKFICQSIYIGTGVHTEQHNQFDQIRACLPPPMCAFPADLMEEVDPHFEIEKEVRERIIDMERKDAEKLEKWRKDMEEKRRQKEEERKAREALLAKGEEGEEAEEGNEPETNK